MSERETMENALREMRQLIAQKLAERAAVMAEIAKLEIVAVGLQNAIALSKD